ncbi:hypothetical protein NMG60_11021045 [Bertholletia excelsa]
MGREKSKHPGLVVWTLAVGLLSQYLLIPVMSVESLEDEKNYYSPDPHAGSPPTGSNSRPPHGSGGSYGSTPPSPSRRTPPSHGGGGGGGGKGESPPSNCGTPPSGGHYNPSPAPPSRGDGYYNTPPPIYGGGGAPTPPITITPPTTPTGPGITIPSPPLVPDPNLPPFTCNYWKNHPALIWGLLGWWGTVGGAFGVAHIPGLGASLRLDQALSNTRTDGYGALYREGTASFLNSIVDKRFPFTTKQVRDSFTKAITSNKAASAQAHFFKLANEGRLKPRA